MAPRGDAKLAFCIFFFITCCTVLQAQMAMDCCLRVTDQKINKIRAVDYHHQISGQGCAIDSTIFVTRYGRKLCAPAHAHWVQKVVEHVDNLKTLCKKLKYKGNRCFGVKPE